MGSLPSCGNQSVDFGAHSVKFSINLMIGKANNLYIKLIHDFRAFLIISKAFGREVLAAIQLDNELGRSAIEIGDKPGNHTLAVDFHRVMTKEIVPQMSFMARHFFSEFLRTWNEFAAIIVVVDRHNSAPFRENPSDLAALGHLPYGRGGFWHAILWLPFIGELSP